MCVVSKGVLNHVIPLCVVLRHGVVMRVVVLGCVV